MIIAIVLLITTVVIAALASKEKGIVFAICTYLCLILSVAVIAISIAFPLIGKKEIIEYKLLQTSVETIGVITGYDNFVEPVDEANAWLIKASENLEKFGIFSKYYKTDLTNLELIVIPEE